MSSTQDWLREDETGRYYVPWQDEYGRTIRRYSEEFYPDTSVFNQAPSSQEYQSTPRYESSHWQKGQSTTGSHHSNSGSRRSRTGREGRGSESGTKRPEDIPEYEERSAPISIRNAPSSKEYHSSPGSNRPPREGYPVADGQGPATAASRFQATSSHDYPNSYNESPSHDWAGRSEDTGLTPGMADLTISDMNNTTFKYFKGHTSLRTTTYLDNRTQAQWPSMTSPDPSFYSGSYQDKAKGVELIQPATQTPRPADSHYITGTKAEQEYLDKSYQVMNYGYKKWFKAGRVFSTLWTDALGSVTNEYDSQFMSTVSVVQYGEKVYPTIRRFVVVKSDKVNACVCLPVTSYNGRGIGKEGIRLDQHGQIYTGDKAPEPVKGIKKEPLRVTLSSGAQKLESHSYINYGNQYTVETNVKVKDIGELDSDSKRLLHKYYNEINFAKYGDDFAESGPPQTAEDRAAEFTGMGGAMTNSGGSYSENPVYDMFYSSSTSDHRPRDDHDINSSSIVAGGGSTVSPWGAHEPTCANSQYSSTPIASASTWLAAGSSSIHRDQRYLDEEDIVLPTLNEVEASRTSRRSSTTQQVGGQRSQARGKNRDGDGDGDGDRDREWAEPGIKLDSTDFPPQSSPAEPSAQRADSLRPPSSQLAPPQSRGPSHSIASSLDTIESSKFSIISTLDMTSAPSIQDQIRRAQPLADFLLAQGWLQEFSRAALQKVTLVKFEENLSRSLLQFSANLKAEGTSSVMVTAAGVVQELARNAAKLIRQWLERQGNFTETPENEDLDLGRATSPLQPIKLQYRESRDDFGKGQEEIKNLELVLLKSMALQLLQENLRLFVHPNPVKEALSEIWPIVYPRDLPLEVEYDLEWQISNFLRTHFAEGQELGKVLTVTGGAVNAQAQSCRDYLTASWPAIGSILLDALHDLLSPGESGVTYTNDVASFNLKLGQNSDTGNLTSYASVVVLACHAVQEQVASALSWLCAAVRYSPHHDIVHSSTSISAKKITGATQQIVIRLAELEENQTNEPCWRPLLPYAVIAKGFPIRNRENGKGLEICFADMALLSQSMSFTEYDEGLVIEGLRSILIPMEILQQDDAIQWHLEYKRQTKSPKRSLSEIFEMSRISKWHKAQKPYEVIEKRCFLGWAEEVSVMIGTAEFSSTKVCRSGADPSPKTRRVRSHTISMGTSGLGFFGANGSMSWQTTSVPSNITLGEIHKDIYDTLADDSN